MANSETNDLLRRVIGLLEGQGKSLESLSTQAVRNSQKATAAASSSEGGGFVGGLGGGLKGAAQGAAGALGVGGLVSGLMSGSPAGIAASAASYLIQDQLGPRFAERDAVNSTIDSANPFESDQLTAARVRMKATEATRVAEARKKFKGSSWRSGFFNYGFARDETIAKNLNLTMRKFIEPQRRVIAGAKSATASQLGGLSQFGGIDENTIQQVYDFNKKFQQNRVAFQKQLEDLAGKEEAVLFNSISN